MKPSTSSVALGLLLSLAAPGAVAIASTDPGEQILLERAAFWRAQQRPDLATETLNKVLALNPGQPDALYQLGALAMQRGDPGGARVYFDRLRQMAPSDPRAAELISTVPLPGARVPATTPAQPAPPAPKTVAAVSPAPVPAPHAAPAAHTAPTLVAESADSDDLTAIAPAKQVAAAKHVQVPQSAQMASLPPTTVGDTMADSPPAATLTVAPKAASKDLAAAAKLVQVSQLELEPPPPVGGYIRPATTTTYSPTDTLEMDIDRNLAQLQRESNPTLTAGFGFRWHDGTSGINQLTEVGVPIEGSFSPWYTGTARFAVLPVYLDAGSLSAANLGQFGANPLLLAKGFPGVFPGAQNVGGVGLLGGYSYGDFTGQIGTTPLGFPVTHLVGMAAYAPKFLDNTLTLRIEGLRQPVTDSILSYAGTHASLATANALSNGAFGHNTTWGGVVKTGGNLSAFYDDQMFGGYASVGLASLTGEQVAPNTEVDALLGGYFRPYKTDNDALRVGVSLYYAGFNKNLGGFTFGQGGYFSPANFEALTFPVEYTGHNGPWSYLASVAIGVQHSNTDSSLIFPYNMNQQQALATTVGANGRIPGATSTGPAFNVKGQLEYAINDTSIIGGAVSFDNGNNYNEVIAKLYLRKTFDWFSPVASSDPSAIAKRDQQSHL